MTECRFVGMTECRFVGMTGFEIAAFIGKTETAPPSFPRRRESRPWDNSNIQRLSESPGFWIPTFVGMTECRFVGMTGFEIAAFIGKNRNRSTVIPAQAGI
ncbi:TPA: hypothetical protein ACJ3IP_002105, partial [Neisseria meningitidis]